jgi:hypothetical protein
MRVLGLALAGVLALSAPMVAHAVPLGSSPEPAKTVRRPALCEYGMAIVRAGIWCPVRRPVAGTKCPVTCASGKGDEFGRLGGRTVLMARGVPFWGRGSHLLGLGSQRRSL